MLQSSHEDRDLKAEVRSPPGLSCGVESKNPIPISQASSAADASSTPDASTDTGLKCTDPTFATALTTARDRY